MRKIENLDPEMPLTDLTVGELMEITNSVQLRAQLQEKIAEHEREIERLQRDGRASQKIFDNAKLLQATTPFEVRSVEEAKKLFEGAVTNGINSCGYILMAIGLPSTGSKIPGQ